MVHSRSQRSNNGSNYPQEHAPTASSCSDSLVVSVVISVEQLASSAALAAVQGQGGARNKLGSKTTAPAAAYPSITLRSRRLSSTETAPERA